MTDISRRGFNSHIPDPHEFVKDAPVCPECGEEGTLTEGGDKYEWWSECSECDYSTGYSDPRI